MVQKHPIRVSAGADAVEILIAAIRWLKTLSVSSGAGRWKAGSVCGCRAMIADNAPVDLGFQYCFLEPPVEDSVVISRPLKDRPPQNSAPENDAAETISACHL
jgi:hypothetical protein